MKCSLVIFLFIGTTLAFADGANSSEGTAEVPGTAVSKASGKDLLQGANDALEQAGMTKDQLKDKDIQQQIADALNATIAQENGEAVTFPIFVIVNGTVTKYIVTLIAADAPAKDIDKIHEEGHRKIDAAAVEALKSAIEKKIKEWNKAGIPQKEQLKKIRDLIGKFENIAHQIFHIIFGGNPGTTKDKIKARAKKNGDTEADELQKLQDEAVKKAIDAAKKDPEIKKLLK